VAKINSAKIKPGLRARLQNPCALHVGYDCRKRSVRRLRRLGGLLDDGLLSLTGTGANGY
jgi:hypothetical protein